MGKGILYIVFSQTFFLICSYINFLQGIKSYHRFNTIHIYYLTVSVSQELGMGFFLLRLLQGCSQVSARAVFSYGKSVSKGSASLLP